MRNPSTLHMATGLQTLTSRALTAFHTKRQAGNRDGGKTPLELRPSQMDSDGVVTDFLEKPLMNDWVNGGFFVFEREHLRLPDRGERIGVRTSPAAGERTPDRRLSASRLLEMPRHV